MGRLKLVIIGMSILIIFIITALLAIYIGLVILVMPAGFQLT